MKKIVLILFAVVLILFAAVAAYFLYNVGKGFTEAARHGGSIAARERRLADMSRQQNIGLPKAYGSSSVMLATKAGPGLRFTYVFQLVKVKKGDLDPSTTASTMKPKVIESLKANPYVADFRKWEVELVFQYLDKEGNEVVTLSFAPQEL